MLKRWSALFRTRSLDRELDEELSIHLAMQEEEFRKRGMDAAAARSAALREFGGLARTAEAYRDRRGLPWVEGVFRDVTYALRGLRRCPGFTAAAVLSLALGIGANTAIFSVFYALMLRLLPVADPVQLVTLTPRPGVGFASWPFYQELNARHDLFTGVTAHRRPDSIELQGKRVGMEQVSANYFAVMGVHPQVGRFFDDQEQGQLLVVLSDSVWRSQYGANPAVVGQSIQAGPRRFTVIGVAPSRFHGEEIESPADLWIPLKPVLDPRTSMYFLLARRAPGVTAKQVESALAVRMANQDAVYNHTNGLREKPYVEVTNGGIGFSLLRQEFAAPLRVLLVTVALVLLATCTNLAHLLIARGTARRKEIAVRISLGAARGRLVRQVLVECLLLSAVGALLGTGLAEWSCRHLSLLVPRHYVVGVDVTPDWPVLAGTAVLAGCAAILFGLLPALRSTAIDPVASLRSDAGGIGRRAGLRRTLVTLQVAFSVVLVIMAALFGHSLAQLRGIDLGFRPQNLVTFWVDYPLGWNESQMDAAWPRMVNETSRLPGVVSMSYVSPDLLQVGSRPTVVSIPRNGRKGTVPLALIGPRFFETLGSTLRQGREFNTRDTAASVKVAVVNEAFVREYFQGASSPLGQPIEFSQEEGARFEVVGVVPDILHADIRRKPLPAVYVPYPQINDVYGQPSMVVRSGLPSAALLPVIRQSLSGMGLGMRPQTVTERIENSIYQERMLASLSGFFGVLALLLAGVGLYGVVAYGTAQRSREIGLRLALGAERLDVLRLVLRDALMLVVLGLTLGLPAAIAGGRAVSSILFGVRAADPSAFLSTAAVLLITGLAAAFLPAHRASRLDPMRALHHE